jgi:RNA polymerase sigma-70 factor (ECF subfamily)
MSDDDDFDELLRRTNDGDQEAAQRFLAKFETEVRTMVRHRLSRKLRTQFDSMDFVQQVWTSFFTGLRENPRRFDNAQHLRGFLAGVARNKVLQEHRRRTATAKFQIEREEPLYVRRGDQIVVRELVGPEPTPSKHAQASERLRQLTEGRAPHEVEIIKLRRQGWTLAEISARTQLSERTIRRIIDSVRPPTEAPQ